MSEAIKHILDANNHASNPWQWYAVKYRRNGSLVDETCFQMHLSREQAEECVAQRSPDWTVRRQNEGMKG
jgi:hypothetical protein